MNRIGKAATAAALAILSLSGVVVAGTCQGTSAAWTTQQNTCGARNLFAQGFNAGGGFSKNLRVNRLAGTTGAAAQAVDSSGNSITSCTVADKGAVDANAELTTNGCGPGVKFIYQITF